MHMRLSWTKWMWTYARALGSERLEKKEEALGPA
jgi:hypothetical protein